MKGAIFELLRIAARYVRIQYRAEPTLNSPHYTPPSGDQGGASTLAVVTLVCGVLSWTLLPVLAGIVGCITGWMELSNIKKGTSSEDGKLITQIGFAACAINVIMTCLGGCIAAAFYFGFIALLFGGAAAAGASEGLAPQ